ncbi:MAG: hypothetical protein C0625_10960 [Arcobacter sp.]|nr:MAG: hypothetical protein C0625_10960 [Arcobacter sp.]
MNSKIIIYDIVYWEKAYSIGHEKIDSEHKRLFEIAAEIKKYSNDSKMIIKIVRELVTYTKFHFRNEENFMRSITYDDLNAHIKLHKELINQLNIVIKGINSKPLDETVSKLAVLVNKDILQHILLEDKKVHHAIKSRAELKEFFKWKVDYKLGSELIDTEHKKLFEIAIKALSCDGADMKSHIKKTIVELYDYMKTHFEHEETFMEGLNYPDLEEHKVLHSNIIKQMNMFIKSLSTLKIVDFERKLIEYMDIWLINHIIYEDKKILKFKNS